MVTIAREREINASADRVWENLRVFGDIHKIHPLVASSHHLAGPTIGVGAERRCNFSADDSRFIIERQIAFDDDTRRQTVEITDGNFAPPARRLTADLSVEEVGPGRSRARMAMNIEGNPLQRLMASTVVRMKFGPALEDILKGLEVRTVTGEDVTDRSSLAGADG